MPAANRLSFLPAASVTGLALMALLASAPPADAQTYAHSFHKIINFRGRFKALNALLTIACLSLAMVPAVATPTSASLPIKIIVASPVSFGEPIKITWSFLNTTSTILSGSVIYNVDSNAVAGLDQPNKNMVQPGKSLSGAFTYANPGPGSHWFSVTFLHINGTPTGPFKLPLQMIDGSGIPHPIANGKPGNTVTALQIAAAGAIRINTSGYSALVANGVPDSVKAQLLKTYAPLLLFSYDHNSQEQYAPIDVVDFIHGSSLVSQDADAPNLSNFQLQDAKIILNPAPQASMPPALQMGTISANQPSPGTDPAHCMPRQIYLSPSSATEHGTDWTTVMNTRNTGMYGHVTLVSLNKLAVTEPALAKEIAGQYDCIRKDGSIDDSCPAQVIKIEFWQFFGYSHDFEDPAPGLTNIIIPGTTAILADKLDHGGDWCTLGLYMDASWAFSSNPDRAIIATYHAAHGCQFTFDLGPSYVTSALEKVQGFPIKEFRGLFYGQPVSIPLTHSQKSASVQAAQNNVVQLAQDPNTHLYVHPVAYVEWDGHEFWPSTAWSFYGASKHNGSGKYHYIAENIPNLGTVTHPNPNPSEFLVTQFAGFWGFYGPIQNDNKPPPGPPLHAEWLWDDDTPNALLKVLPASPPY